MPVIAEVNVIVVADTHVLVIAAVDMHLIVNAPGVMGAKQRLVLIGMIWE